MRARGVAMGGPEESARDRRLTLLGFGNRQKG
jgi:hypothetical protein